MPLAPMPAMEDGAMPLSASILRVTKTKSPHQSCSASCSAQPGCGTCILVGARRLRDDLARRGDDHPLGLEGADVDAEIVLHSK